MRILLFGRNGQVGWELQRSLTPLAEVIALDRYGEAGLCGDLLDPDGLAATVQAVRPAVIVNAAAYTAVDRAEGEQGLARRANALAPAALARAAAACSALLVHYGTDYVFDGAGDRPWQEDDETAPLNVYGRTKLEGEQAILQSGCRHLILRTSWVFGPRGHNFLMTMLRLAVRPERITVVDDQWGAPTSAELVADVTAHAIMQVLVEPALCGLYHVAAAGATNWYAYGRHLLERARVLDPGGPAALAALAPIPSSAYRAAARRPHNSRLDTTRLCAAFGLRMPRWEQGVDRALADLLAGAKTPGLLRA